MSTLRDEQILEAITERAAHWYLRHREGDLSASEEEEFLDWLRLSLQHTHEYLAVARLSGGIRDALADLKLDREELCAFLDKTDAEKALPRIGVISRSSVHGGGRPRRVLVPLAAMLCLAAFGIYWLSDPGLPGLPRVVSVSHGEHRTLRLRDGTLMHLNANSRVRVHFSMVERWIDLDEGQALFEVAHDATRPFRVHAGATDVVAIGTQFDVSRFDPTHVTVTVVEGKVEVIPQVHRSDIAITQSSAPALSAVRLSAGQRLRFKGNVQEGNAELVDVNRATSWVRNEIIFEGRRLGEVANEFNRYIPVPIEIEDPSLRELKVSGMFNTYDTDSFVEFLRQYDVSIERSAAAIRVQRQR